MDYFKKIVFDLFIAVLMVATGTINTLAAKYVCVFIHKLLLVDNKTILL